MSHHHHHHDHHGHHHHGHHHGHHHHDQILHHGHHHHDHHHHQVAPIHHTVTSTIAPSLTPGILRQGAQKEGYLTKQGGIIRNWKRRLFILNGMALYYFVSPSSLEPQGVIHLRGATVVKNNPTGTQFPHACKPSLVIALDTPSRRYYLEADNETEYKHWVEALQNASRGILQTPQFYSQPQPATTTTVTQTTQTVAGVMGPPTVVIPTSTQPPVVHSTPTPTPTHTQPPVAIFVASQQAQPQHQPQQHHQPQPQPQQQHHQPQPYAYVAYPGAPPPVYHGYPQLPPSGQAHPPYGGPPPLPLPPSAQQHAGTMYHGGPPPPVVGPTAVHGQVYHPPSSSIPGAAPYAPSAPPKGEFGY